MNNLEYKSKICKGAYGSVFKVADKRGNKSYAVKIVSAQRDLIFIAKER